MSRKFKVFVFIIVLKIGCYRVIWENYSLKSGKAEFRLCKNFVTNCNLTCHITGGNSGFCVWSCFFIITKNRFFICNKGVTICNDTCHNLQLYLSLFATRVSQFAERVSLLYVFKNNKFIIILSQCFWRKVWIAKKRFATIPVTFCSFTCHITMENNFLFLWL